MNQSRRLVILLCVLAMLLPGCSSTVTQETAASCRDLADDVVAAVQTFVDGFDGTSSGDADRLAAEAERLRVQIQLFQCHGDEFDARVLYGLQDLHVGTPLQRAVAKAFQEDPLGMLEPEATLEPGISTAADLVRTVAQAQAGARITVPPGHFVLDAPLLLVRPITLVGAGQGRTTLSLASAEPTVVVAADGNVVVEDLSIQHSGDEGASVVLLGGGGYHLERVTISGARNARDGSGFGLILTSQLEVTDPTHLKNRLVDVTLEDNQGGGVLVADDQSPDVENLTVLGTQGCAMCFQMDASGTVDGLRVEDADVFLRLDDAASVEVADGNITDVATGVQMASSGHLSLTGIVLANVRELGVRLAGTGTAILDGIDISGAANMGIVAVEEVEGRISGARVETTGEVGIVWGEDADGSAVGLEVRGQRIGIQLSQSGHVDVTDATSDGTDAALFSDQTGSGSVAGLVCENGPIVVHADAVLDIRDSPDCHVAVMTDE